MDDDDIDHFRACSTIPLDFIDKRCIRMRLLTPDGDCIRAFLIKNLQYNFIWMADEAWY